MIEGLPTENFSVGKKCIPSDVPGYGPLNTWSRLAEETGPNDVGFEAQRIPFGDCGWIAFQRETETGCRRLYAERDVVLLPKQEPIVPDRLSRNTRMTGPSEAVTEGHKCVFGLGMAPHPARGAHIAPRKLTLTAMVPLVFKALNKDYEATV